MKILTWNDILTFLNTGIENPFFEVGTGISIGSFDGLHLGHRKLIESLVDNCKKKQLLPGVITFKRPLPSIKHYQDYQGDISTLQQRLDLLEQLGVEFVIVVDFDDTFASILGTDFLNILVNSCNMQFIAEGVDFRFGYKGATDVAAIKYYCEQHHIGFSFVDQLIFKPGSEEEQRVSSSHIRQLIFKGFFATVEELLNRPYSIDLTKKDILQVIPPDGVYYCKTENNREVKVQIKKRKISTSVNCNFIYF